jgi:hypothetical protein
MLYKAIQTQGVKNGQTLEGAGGGPSRILSLRIILSILPARIFNDRDNNGNKECLAHKNDRINRPGISQGKTIETERGA